MQHITRETRQNDQLKVPLDIKLCLQCRFQNSFLIKSRWERLHPIRDEEEEELENAEEEEKLEQERKSINKIRKNEEETPSKEEIERVTKRMKNNKAPREDGIIVELISPAGSEMREKICKVIK
jgi:hypothetical protein